MPEVVVRRVPFAEKEAFTRHFQDYLAELAGLNGAAPDRQGRFAYDYYDLYWIDPTRQAYYVIADGQTAGLLLLRELTPAESPLGREAMQVAEICVFRTQRRRGVGMEIMRFAARVAESRRLPLTWSAYMSNGPANALYNAVLLEFGSLPVPWATERTRGIDRSGLARFYYQMVPARGDASAPGGSC